MPSSKQQKRALGSYYTQGNPFVYKAFSQWFSKLPGRQVILEPFIGDGQIPRLLEEAGFKANWQGYDVDPAIEGVPHRDTIADYPSDYQVTITNPPWLSYHFAKRKGLSVNKDYFRGYTSLYQTAIDEALNNCDYVAMIIPESFVTSGLFRERLEHVVSLPMEMFDDTEMPTALALWGKDESKDFKVWRQNKLLGNFSKLAAEIKTTPCADRIKFNVVSGKIGLKAIDGTAGPSIAFCLPDEIPAEKIKHSARLVSRIEVDNLKNTDEVISEANKALSKWRDDSEDVMLTAFKGPRKDGKFRRRLDFANARALLAQALCKVEKHSH